MKKKYFNNKGFTLVELLVVLVIIGILASIMIPSFTGYIKKQKQKEAIQECKQVVASTQNYFMDKLTKNQIVSTGISEDNEKKEVLKLAGVNGSFEGVPVFDGTLSVDNPDPTFRVLRLSYKSTNGYTVQYNSSKSKEYYTIVEGKTYTELDEFVLEYQKKSKELWAKGIITKDKTSREYITQAMLKEYGGTLPSVDPKYLTSDLLSHYHGDLYWQPYYIANNVPSQGDSTPSFVSSDLTVLFATPQSGRDATGAVSSTDTIKNMWRAFLVYVNGRIFETTKVSYKNQSTDIKESTAGIAELYKYSNEEDICKYLVSSGFREVT